MYALMSLVPSTSALLIVLFVGMMLFGKNLPEMGRLLARGIREFKMGLSGIEDEVLRPVLHQPQPAGVAQLPARVTNSKEFDNHDAGAPPSV